MLEELKGGRRLGYALGNPGFILCESIVLSIAFYFYLPPEGAGLEPLLTTELFWGVLTAIGLARVIGGVVDSLADPVVGFASDRSRSRLGRRRVFLIVGVLPMVGFPVMLFWPPGEPGGALNFWWLTVGLAAYYVFFTVYVGPYLALIPELAREQAARLRLSTLLAFITLPAFVLFQPAWLWGVDAARESGLGAREAVQLVVVVISVIALLLCLAPIAAVDEARFARPEPSTLPLRDALRETMANRPFLVYMAAQISFILGVTMLRPSAPYFAIVVLGRDEAFAALLSAAMVPAALLGFACVGRIGDRLGPKRTIMGSVALLAVASLMFGLITPGGGEPASPAATAQAFVAMALVGFALAGFAVLPHVMLGELIDLDARRTGANRSAMFYGAQGLFTKWSYQFSLAILSFLLQRYGNSPEVPDGVLAIGLVAAGFCVLSFTIYAFYPEREVLAAAARGG